MFDRLVEIENKYVITNQKIEPTEELKKFVIEFFGEKLYNIGYDTYTVGFWQKRDFAYI